MKKILALGLALILALTALTACQSPLSRGLERAEKQYGGEELDLSKVFSEAEGYHHPQIPWGKTMTELQNENLATLTQLMDVDEDGGSSYKISGIYLKLQGRWNDSTVVVVPANGVIRLVSVVYTLGDDEDKQPIGLTELYPSYLEKLTEAFGEPEVEEESRTVETTKVKYVTNYWEYTRPDGQETQLQWAAAYLSGSSEPSYLTLGFTVGSDDAE